MKKNRINLILGGIISGTEENKQKFVQELKKDRRIIGAEQHYDFILIHAQHPSSREARAEIKIFYNPQFIRVKPVHISTDGWEDWEVACLSREELNRLVQASIKHYNGKLLSLRQETVKSVASLELVPTFTDKQLEALKIAYKEGYYRYPRKLTIPQLAKSIKRSYSTFQENLRKAENKLIDHFLRYR
ncbi:MAG TPA: helix-turn-helix domain-containing protein [Candidatus Nanoarchaeia archaeon]|nr:helix-turn-helix domain-containing protein [Candidatus Nanoarchaeia archaeon]